MFEVSSTPFGDVLNLMFLKGVLSIFLIPLPKKFMTYWRMLIKKKPLGMTMYHQKL